MRRSPLADAALDGAALPCPSPKFKPSPDAPLHRLGDELVELYGAGRSKSATSRIDLLFRELKDVGGSTTGDLDGFEGAKLVERYRAWLHRRGRAAATQRTKLATLKSCVEYGVKRKYLETSPFEVWTPKVVGGKPKRKRHLTLDEICAVIDGLRREAIDGWKQARLFAAVSTVAYAGLRATEALRLKKADVDLENRTISVVRRTSLKTVGSEREFPMPEALAEVLELWLPKSHSPYLFPNVTNPDPWLFGSHGDRPLDAFKIAAARYGVKDVTFLCLRHSWATMATMVWGLSPAQVAIVMGHTRISTAFENYVEADVEALRFRMQSIRFPTAGERRIERGQNPRPAAAAGA